VWHLVDLLAVFVLGAVVVFGDTVPDGEGPERYFYVIAHRTNSLEAVRQAAGDGANAIEIDVRREGARFCANHDALTQAVGCEDLATLLDGVAEVAAAQPRLALVILDLKELGGQGDEVLALARQKLPGLNLLLSVAELAKVGDLPDGPLRAHEGVGIDQEDDPNAVATWFEAHDRARCAYGNGISAWVPEAGMRRGIKRALAERRCPFVYVWTLERDATMRTYIALGVDGIFVNGSDSGEGTENAVPDLVKLVGASSSLTLAPRDHDPFARARVP
jgi:glycerophosphoryl diester phosphodiesterase